MHGKSAPLAMQDSPGLHPLWREVKTLDGKTFYFSPFSGLLSLERFAAPPPVKGGILADEMVSLRQSITFTDHSVMHAFHCHAIAH